MFLIHRHRNDVFSRLCSINGLLNECIWKDAVSSSRPSRMKSHVSAYIPYLPSLPVIAFDLTPSLRGVMGFLVVTRWCPTRSLGFSSSLEQYKLINVNHLLLNSDVWHAVRWYCPAPLWNTNILFPILVTDSQCQFISRKCVTYL